MNGTKPKYGALIAKPNACGGYDIFQYRGKWSGWWPAGIARNELQAREQMANLKRPIIVAGETESEAV